MSKQYTHTNPNGTTFQSQYSPQEIQAIRDSIPADVNSGIIISKAYVPPPVNNMGNRGGRGFTDGDVVDQR